MRVKITCGDAIYETIGEEVSFDGFDDKFAVHQNIKNDDDFKVFCVTHIDTGFRLEAGLTIDDVIEKAKYKLQLVGIDKLKEAIARASQIKSEIHDTKDI